MNLYCFRTESIKSVKFHITVQYLIWKAEIKMQYLEKYSHLFKSWHVTIRNMLDLCFSGVYVTDQHEADERIHGLYKFFNSCIFCHKPWWRACRKRWSGLMRPTLNCMVSMQSHMTCTVQHVQHVLCFFLISSLDMMRLYIWMARCADFSLYDWIPKSEIDASLPYELWMRNEDTTPSHHHLRGSWLQSHYMASSFVTC